VGQFDRGGDFALARLAVLRHNKKMGAPKSKARFNAVETKDGEWHVRLTLPGGKQPQIDGFKTASEAHRWIKAQSAAWLKMYEGGKYV
jgi:hypothetical protein